MHQSPRDEDRGLQILLTMTSLCYVNHHRFEPISALMLAVAKGLLEVIRIYGLVFPDWDWKRQLAPC